MKCLEVQKRMDKDGAREKPDDNWGAMECTSEVSASNDRGIGGANGRSARLTRAPLTGYPIRHINAHPATPLTHTRGTDP